MSMSRIDHTISVARINDTISVARIDNTISVAGIGNLMSVSRTDFVMSVLNQGQINKESSNTCRERFWAQEVTADVFHHDRPSRRQQA